MKLNYARSKEMYKAIKDNKIIAVSDTDSEFPFFKKDSVQIDETHVAADYAEYNSEYLLKSEIPAPTHDEQSKKREAAYKEEVDLITCHINRLRDIDPVPQEEIDELLAERDAKTQEIKERYPYPEEE